MPEDEQPDPDVTSAMPKLELRLADFLKGDPPLPRAILLVVAGEARGTVLPLDTFPATIGRSDDADVRLDDQAVSRHHAVLTHDSEGVVLEDLESSNGTTINGNRLAAPMHLTDGDLVGFGTAIVLVKVIV